MRIRRIGKPGGKETKQSQLSDLEEMIHVHKWDIRRERDTHIYLVMFITNTKIVKQGRLI